MAEKLFWVAAATLAFGAAPSSAELAACKFVPWETVGPSRHGEIIYPLGLSSRDVSGLHICVGALHRTTAAVLAQQTDPEIDALIKQLDDRNDKMQYAAAWELGERGPAAAAAVPKLTEKIRQFLAQPEASYEKMATARAAAQALGRIGEPDPAAIEMLDALAYWAANEDRQLHNVSLEALRALRE